MARKPKNYWETRSTELMQRLEKETENTINSLIQVYEQATKNINKEISNIFKNYAKDTGLSKETLLQMLNTKETETHYKNLLEVINNKITDESIKKKLLAKYNAPSYNYRISRYQALQDNIDMELKKLANIEQEVTKIRYVDTIKEGYYHNIYDIQKGTGLEFSFAQIDNRTINLMLNEKWTNHANFSQRIWKNNEKLGDFLKIQLTAKEMSGKSIQKLSRELADYMNVGLYNATTLVRTEVNHFANEAEMLAYEELDIDKYRFIATLDIRTCKHCAKLDNKVFNVKDRKAEENYPPIHPNDRCTTVAEMDDGVIDGLQRRAKDPVTGKTYLIDKNITYNEWKQQVDNKYRKGTFDLEHKKYTNLKSDKEQYKSYKDLLGKENVPETFASFQEMKYNNISEYRLTKYNYKLQNEARKNPQNVINEISIAEEKYTKYIFDGSNKDGLIKGKLISEVLGYDINNYKEFDKLIKSNINKFPKHFKGNDIYGDKFEVNMVLKGLKNRQAKVTLGSRYISNEYKLSSVYISKLKESDLKYED